MSHQRPHPSSLRSTASPYTVLVAGLEIWPGGAGSSDNTAPMRVAAATRSPSSTRSAWAA
ncbi:hypothetical protein ACWEJ6_52265 [Nonomuraea sp. NPDC004702]